jgi:FixJ family two-component response regulator
VDDDPAVCDALRFLIESIGLPVETYASGQAFLDVYHPGRPGCVVLDVRMAGMSGLELQARLSACKFCLPVVFITAHGDVPTAVRALKGGALDFLEKPFSGELLLDCVREAVERDRQLRAATAQRADAVARLALLTPREREVMGLVIAGRSNKAIAAQLDLSIKTVEAHRAKVMHKTQARSVADLVRLALLAEGDQPGES